MIFNISATKPLYRLTLQNRHEDAFQLLATRDQGAIDHGSLDTKSVEPNDRDQFGADIKEALIVELYSK